MKQSVVKRLRVVFAILVFISLPTGILVCSPSLRIQLLRMLQPLSAAGTRMDYVSTAPMDGFSFSVVSDMRYYGGPGEYDTSDYFRGALEALAGVGMGSFLVVPGDMDPVSGVQWTIEQVLGADTRWYPVIGNHELPGEGEESSLGANLAVLQTFDIYRLNMDTGAYVWDAERHKRRDS